MFAPQAFRALPPAIEEQFQSLRVTELKAIATRMAVPNRNKVKRTADIIQFLISHQAPLAPTYEQLFAFWVERADLLAAKIQMLEQIAADAVAAGRENNAIRAIRLLNELVGPPYG